MAAIVGFHVERLLPAKFSAVARLQVDCNTDYPEMPVKRLTICEADGADALNELAARIAAATGKAYELGDYGYDS